MAKINDRDVMEFLLDMRYFDTAATLVAETIGRIRLIEAVENEDIGSELQKKAGGHWQYDMDALADMAMLFMPPLNNTAFLCESFDTASDEDCFIAAISLSLEEQGPPLVEE
jgi:hypothetical protein